MSLILPFKGLVFNHQEYPQNPVLARSPSLVIWGFSSMFLEISPGFIHCVVTQP